MSLYLFNYAYICIFVSALSDPTSNSERSANGGNKQILYCIVQPFLQPHFTSSWHVFVISDSVVQKARHSPLSDIHPQSCGLGMGGFGTRACSQLWPACYAVRLICSSNKSRVGGRASKFRFLWVNNCFLASFSDKELLFLSYSKTTKRSRVHIHSSPISV